MDEQMNRPPRQPGPRRRKRSQLQIFKETYLPLVIFGIAVILIIIFISGSITRGVARSKVAREESIAASESLAIEEERLSAEAVKLLTHAEYLADGYNYLDAIAALDTFSGKLEDYPELSDKRAEYVQAQAGTVAWDDPNEIIHLSFQPLIADPPRAFDGGTYTTSYNRNFVTIEEFSKILQQLYENGYMLVSLNDFTTVTTGADGASVISAKTLYLPEGKKPLILTETGANYYKYMIDGNGDGAPDKRGDGFANRLLVANDGSITCEMVDAEDNFQTGAFDMVPILDAFVQAHPDFSFNHAKAVIAVTGYEGLFGYRTTPNDKSSLSDEAYKAQVDGAMAVADALRKNGYTIACYTYKNAPYGDYSATEIQADLTNWTDEVVPILGEVDILAFAQRSDIADAEAYSGEKYDVLKNAGFHYYLGFSFSGGPWTDITDAYVRQGRILVNGSNMKDHPEWFTGMFDAGSILDPTRPS